MKKQLHIPINTLMEMGFKGRQQTHSTERVYELTPKNHKEDVIRFFPESTGHCWYMHTTNGATEKNTAIILNIRLNIETMNDLLTTMKVFGYGDYDYTYDANDNIVLSNNVRKECVYDDSFEKIFVKLNYPCTTDLFRDMLDITIDKLGASEKKCKVRPPRPDIKPFKYGL